MNILLITRILLLILIVSSILVQMAPHINVLLDTGEGCWGQLWRHFASFADLVSCLKDLQCVWISHNHADHHLGLVHLLYKRQQLVPDAIHSPVKVIAPIQIKYWLEEYAKVIDPLIQEQYLYIDSSLQENVDPLLPSLQLTSLLSIPVKHCHLAYALVITHTSGWKLAYSGDCRPSETFIEAGRGANVLIHEATFEDELVDEAVSKAHCTTSEAIGVGRDMGAETIVLTHFSQRYPKMPVLKEESEVTNVTIAFDLLSITLKHLKEIPRQWKRIQQEVEGEDKA